MNTRVPCTNCQVMLVVRDDVRLEWITCPRCLTAIRNPQVPTSTEGVRCTRCDRMNPGHRNQCLFCAAILTPAPRTSGTKVVVCTVCAEALPGHAANCPLSPAKSRSPNPAWDDPSADSDARSDTDRTRGPAMALLFMICAVAGITFGPAGVLLGLVFLGTSMVGNKGTMLGRLMKTLGYLMLVFGVITALLFAAFWIVCAVGRR
jgi:hypothetical protein